MPQYGKYNLTDEQIAFVREERDNACKGIDIEFAVDCSGSMSIRDVNQPAPRFDIAKQLVKALAAAVLHYDDEISIWKIKDQSFSAFRKNSRVQDGLKSPEAVIQFIDKLGWGGGTPFRTVLQAALDRYLARLRKNPKATKPFNLIIVGDGHDGQITDIVQKAAVEIFDLTGEDPRKRLGIQFLLVTNAPDVVEAFSSFDDIPAYEHKGRMVEADVVDVTTIDEIVAMGGIQSEFCQAKILAGALSEPLDNMLRDLDEMMADHPPAYN